MEKLFINGGKPLSGSIDIHGAKNSALPLLASTILSHGENSLHNIPDIADVRTEIKILRHLGCRVTRSGSILSVNPDSMVRCDIPNEMMREMRSSVVFSAPSLPDAAK